MTAVRDLGTLIRTMHPTAGPETYVFVSVAAGDPVPGGMVPIMMFREAEGLTLIVPRDQAAGTSSSFPSRMITLNVQSALDAIGFLAKVTARLAEAGIAVNAVSAFHHDHLFVPEADIDRALAILSAMADA